MVRWWWFGPELARTDTVRQLTAMADAGLGGVEAAFVYPLTEVEHPFLSPEFLADLRFAAETATGLGLRFDLTLCSGWPFGGPHVTPDTASRRLEWDVREIGAEALDLPVAPRWPGEEFVAAYVGDGSQHERPSAFDRAPMIGGSVRIPPGRGPRLVAVSTSAPTGQQVKRAAAGAEGYVLDHYSAQAVREYLHTIADPLLDAAGPQNVGSVFCDSLEAYDADFTPDLIQELATRRASDSGGAPDSDALLDDLWMLRFDAAGSDRLRSAHFEALADLFERNFLQVIHDWANARGVAFRVQNYGVPPTRLGGYRFVDVIEGEGWGWRGIPQTRWAASAAHRLRAAEGARAMRGASAREGARASGIESPSSRNVVSSEVWTWVHSPSLRAVPLDLKGEAHEHFLLGINQFVGHGWPASTVDAPGVGRLFYASGALDDRNAWWPAMPELTRYLARVCWMLRNGDPVADVTLYLPSSDVHATLGLKQTARLDLWRACRARIGEVIPAAIRDAGLDFDLIDDHLIDGVAPEIAAAGPVVLPHVERLPEHTREWLRAVRAAGGTVIEVRADGPASAALAPTGLGGSAGLGLGRVIGEDELGAALRACIAPDLTVMPACADIGFVHRHVGAADVYFVANTGVETRRITLAPRAHHRAWQRWDATTGRIVAEGDGGAVIALELAPYEATVLVVGDGLPTWEGDRGHGETVAGAAGVPVVDTATRPAVAVLGNGRTAGSVDGAWTVAFPGADPVAVRLPHDWAPERPHFAGTGVYERTFPADELWGAGRPARVELDFGEAIPTWAADGSERGIRGASYRTEVESPIREVAVVELNGIECGVLYAPPYRLDVTHAVRPGANVLRVAVSNASAAALGDPDAISAIDATVDGTRTRYGQRFRMQDLEHATDGLRSGLLTVPTLRWSMG